MVKVKIKIQLESHYHLATNSMRQTHYIFFAK